MFLLKKIVSAFFLPMPLCSIILLLGVVFLWVGRRQKLGKTLVSFGTILLLIMSYDVTSNAILRPLEKTYPPILNPQLKQL